MACCTWAIVAGLLLAVAWQFTRPRRRLGQGSRAWKQEDRRRAASHDAHGPLDAIVVGGGFGGLAAASVLKADGLRVRVLEAAGAVGHKWRKRYDRLHLHTGSAVVGLPFLPWPDNAALYPSRTAVADYLQGYARIMNLDVQLHSRVTKARWNARSEQWDVTVSVRLAGAAEGKEADEDDAAECEQVQMSAAYLVVATGENGKPKTPDIPGLDSFPGPVCHSAHYRNGSALRDKRVLVVGFGNSGAEMCVETYEHGAKPSVVVRSPVCIVPRNFVHAAVNNIALFNIYRSMPLWMADKVFELILLFVGDLSPWNIRQESKKIMTRLWYEHKPMVIDIGALELIKRGDVSVIPHEVQCIRKDKVVFADDSQQSFDAIIFATGFNTRTSYMDFLAPAVVDGLFNEHGVVMSGPSPAARNLYFIGHNDISSKLGEMRVDAFRIGKHIRKARKAAAAAAAAAH